MIESLAAVVAVLCALGAAVCASRSRYWLLRARRAAARLEELDAERQHVCRYGHPWAYADIVDGARIGYCHDGHWTYPTSTGELDEPQQWGAP